MSEDQFKIILENISSQISEIWGAIDGIRTNTHKIELNQESRLSTLEQQFKNNKWLLGLVVVLIFGVASKYLVKY